MLKPTPQQEGMPDHLLTRDLLLVSRYYLDSQRNFVEMVIQMCKETLEKGEKFVVLDIGTGSGTSLEELVRTLKLLNEEHRDNIVGVGLDLQVLLDKMHPKALQLTELNGTKDPLPSNVRLGNYVKASAESLLLADNSINFGYSVGTLIYIGDVLKCLEEMYRTLKPGGKYLVNAHTNDISMFPPFEQIIRSTPGAEDVFEFIQSPYDKNTGFVEINKSPNDTFKGFPFKVGQIFTRPQVFNETTGTHKDHYQNAIYFTDRSRGISLMHAEEITSQLKAIQQQIQLILSGYRK